MRDVSLILLFFDTNRGTCKFTIYLPTLSSSSLEFSHRSAYRGACGGSKNKVRKGCKKEDSFRKCAGGIEQERWHADMVVEFW